MAVPKTPTGGPLRFHAPAAKPPPRPKLGEPLPAREFVARPKIPKPPAGAASSGQASAFWTRMDRKGHTEARAREDFDAVLLQLSGGSPRMRESLEEFASGAVGNLTVTLAAERFYTGTSFWHSRRRVLQACEMIFGSDSYHRHPNTGRLLLTTADVADVLKRSGFLADEEVVSPEAAERFAEMVNAIFVEDDYDRPDDDEYLTAMACVFNDVERIMTYAVRPTHISYMRPLVISERQFDDLCGLFLDHGLMEETEVMHPRAVRNLAVTIQDMKFSPQQVRTAREAFVPRVATQPAQLATTTRTSPLQLLSGGFAALDRAFVAGLDLVFSPFTLAGGFLVSLLSSATRRSPASSPPTEPPRAKDPEPEAVVETEPKSAEEQARNDLYTWALRHFRHRIKTDVAVMNRDGISEDAIFAALLQVDAVTDCVDQAWERLRDGSSVPHDPGHPENDPILKSFFDGLDTDVNFQEFMVLVDRMDEDAHAPTEFVSKSSLRPREP